MRCHLSGTFSGAKKCQFSMGWDPFWAWLCSILDRHDAIKELLNCVLAGLMRYKKPRRPGVTLLPQT